MDTRNVVSQGSQVNTCFQNYFPFKSGASFSATEDRIVRPLALAFWSGVWTLAAWCETREDFRTFRLDRIEQAEDAGRTFVQKRGQRLEDLLKKVRADAAREARGTDRK